MKQEIENLVPDFYEWPVRWMGVEEDLEYGKRLLKQFEPFVYEIAVGKLTKKTKHKHVDNLWLAGGELIRNVSIDEEYEKDPLKLLHESFFPSGGPSCRHIETETQISSYDSTCRKFYKFLNKH